MKYVHGSASKIRASSSGPGRRAALAATARRRRRQGDLLDDERAAAAELVRGRPELLSLLSHDLRNPLSIITLGLHSLGRVVGPEHPARRHVDSLRRAADELGSMLDNTSEAARVDRGEVPLTLGAEPVRAIVEAAAAAPSLRRIADDRQITVATEIAEGCVARCARDKMVRVLVDLLGRAVRIAPKRSTVTVSAACDDDTVRIAVSDGAPEIPARYRESAFDMPRDDQERRALGPAFALDLYVAGGVVEAQDGSIRVEPAEGGGTTFVITLPVGG
jgi:signal transduction histidine kinase